MVPDGVKKLINGNSDVLDDLFGDHHSVMVVDWGEEDDAIVRYCENILQTGDLSAEVTNIDEDPGFEIHINYRGKRVRVPLVIGVEDRHITLHTLNQLLKPDYDIRVFDASNGSDTLVFLPLRSSEWAQLENEFGNKVEKHFRKIEEHPNLFTEGW